VKIVFVDIETTGLDFDMHAPLDIALVVADIDEFSWWQKVHAYTACIACDAHDWALAEKEALQVNGYTPENHAPLAKHPAEVKAEIIKFLDHHGIQKDHSFFLCQNPAFDKPFFLQIISQDEMKDRGWPYHWLDLASMFWIKFYGSCYPSPHKLSLSKDNIAKHFGLSWESRPHRAINGAMHLVHCYQKVSCWNTCFPPEPVIYGEFKG